MKLQKSISVFIIKQEVLSDRYIATHEIITNFQLNVLKHVKNV